MARPVTVTITRQTATPARAGFDVALLAAAHDLPGPRVREYGGLEEAEDDGLTADDYPWIHRLLTLYFSQDPSASRILVGRRDNKPTQSLSLVPIVYGEGHVYEIEIEGETASYTAEADDELADVVAGIVAAIEALDAPVTATDTGPGESVAISCTEDGRQLSISCDPLSVGPITWTTTDPGVAEDLSAIRSEREDWYGLLLDSTSRAEVEAASTWAQSRSVLYSAAVDEAEVVDSSVEDDVASTLRDLNNDRTTLLYTGQQIGHGYDVAMLGRALPGWDPGSATWAYKVLTGVLPLDLKTGETSALEAKRVNYYGRVSDVPVTVGGYVSRASFEYADVVRGLDWFKARSRERLETVLLQNDKLPIDDVSIEVVRSALEEVVDLAIERLIFKADPRPTIAVPLAEDVSLADRAERLLRGIEPAATLAQAIHKIEVTGTVGL